MAGWLYLRLILLGALIGIPAALVAAAFLGLVHYLEHWLWHDLPSALGSSTPPWYLVIALPFVGALIVLIARKLLPGDGGHPPLKGLSYTPTRLAYVPGIVLAALGTLGFGAVLGPEAPVIALGSAVGVAATLLVRLDQRGDAVISTAGSASAISALFGGPLVAGMLMTEGGLAMGAGLLPALIPGFVAAAVGYLIFTGFGNWGGLNAPGLLIPNLPAYSGVHLLDLLVAVVVGVLAALVINGVHRLAAGVDRLVGRLTMPGVLLGGGLAVGLLAEAVSLLGANSQDELFSGQSSIPALVSSGSFKIVLILVVFKSLGYAVSLGCGFRGGPIFPAIFLGVGLASISVVWFGVSPTLAIAIGTAAGMAAQTRLILSGLVFALLLVGSGGFAAIPAAVLAAVAAWLTASALARPAEPAPASAGSRSPG